MGHLTNYSLNKRSEKFVHAGQSMDTVLDPSSNASKRPMSSVLRQIEMEHPSFNAERFYESLVAMVETSTAAMVPVLAASHSGVRDEMRCFQILGFDVMLDR